MLGVKSTPSARSGANFLVKSLIFGAAILAVNGLGFAAATQLGSNWNGNFQAGAVEVATECQPSSSPVTVTLGDPEFVGTGDVPWRITEVEFSQIDSKCNGLHYQVAYRVNQEWQTFDSPSAEGVISGSRLLVDFSGTDISEADEFSLTFFN